jgi:hypothetical protein
VWIGCIIGLENIVENELDRKKHIVYSIRIPCNGNPISNVVYLGNQNPIKGI